jgi:glutathionylspermidine synthase
LSLTPRHNWQATAERYGFRFHTLYAEPYWDESHAYALTLKQIEDDLESPTEELAAMCLDIVDRAIRNEEWLRRLAIPEPMWAVIRDSWRRDDPSLYGRFDFSYAGSGNAKLYEYNADTPTSLYESAFFQWLWLEEAAATRIIPHDADQFNSIQEKLITRFSVLPGKGLSRLHLACVEDNEEDAGTLLYLEDCARQAGLTTQQIAIGDIGINADRQFVDMEGDQITWLFKLYPWEWMFRENYAVYLMASKTRFLEPPWKAILSNKGLLALLWLRFPGHPNLLPSWFSDDPKASISGDYVRKPLYSREGANVEVFRQGRCIEWTLGPYGDEGGIVQALHIPPNFDDIHTVIGSWVIDREAAGIGIREDKSIITRDSSRFVPHFIDG